MEKIHKLRYSDLTDYQKSKICNGCGAKGWKIKIPQFLFNASCKQHDFYYWRGGDESDRKQADKDFYRFMRIDANKPDELYKKIWYHTWAFVYYVSVRIGGKSSFQYRDTYKTMEDVIEITLK